MLDVETKRRIDTARDILVGKVPDPKSQVEQITIALIYKFMDDMDAEAEELGGERTFFKGEFERYGWTKLMAPNMGGYDVITLYSESIQKMNENPNIPQLFRDIFKNAYLPYRDPETLKSFLKIINAFSYDHSEKLGDAFEYLLSVLGSQGEAGQFRTPRHIIDFMVEVIEPKKNESILDPACGTAGFLISSYKHIRKHNSSSFKPDADREAFDEKGVSIEELTLDSPKNYKGDLLTPDDRARLSGNIRGLDISPDMVRLSLVNMYLHGFTEPHIYEYDTLTSEERWNEFYDIILANPPFMSPKGGIKPHKRFSVQSNRSEVLFVDYIAEHITPTGRAAVIVPEGIIFQSGTAYKQLRKMLVDNYLFAVVSLPAGVFNPYSGVKTSILFMDKPLAKKTDKIFFVKIESDGFGLGAQRRPIDRNDLPEALKAIKDYRAKVANGEAFEAEKWANVLVVEKESIAENGDYSLSGERYRTNDFGKSAKYGLVTLGEIATVISGQSPEGEFYNETREGLPFYQGKTEFGDIYLGPPKKWTTQITREAYQNDVLMSVRAPVGPVNIATQKICIGRGLAAIRASDKLDYLYLFYFLKSMQDKIVGGGGSVFDSINRSQIESLKIPLPPLEVQKEIVAEIEGYQKIIDGARQVVQNYKPQIQIDPKWEMVELSSICDVRDGTHDSPKYVQEGYPLITSKNLKDGLIDFENANLISKADLDAINQRSKVDDGDILMPMIGTIGNPIIATVDRDFAIKNVALIKFYEESKIDRYFLNVLLGSAFFQAHFNVQASGSTQRFIALGFVRKLLIPLPDLETQNQIVARIEKEQELVNANKELIRIFEQKIKDRVAVVWGES